MEHSHHHHHEHRLSSLNSVFVFSIILNLAFVAVEAGVGLWSNSLGLLSDAGHNLGDVFSLLLAMFAFRLSGVRSNMRYTYGYKKSTILISLLNSVILIIAVVAIFVESISKISNSESVNGNAVMLTAVVGIVVNGATALMLMRQQKTDLNVRGAFLHMAADTLVSLGVVVSGLLIKYTGLYVIDPIVGIIVSAVILVSTWKLLSESIRLSLDGVPREVNMDEVRNAILGFPDVCEVHHIHVWAISTNDVALTAHVVVDSVGQMKLLKPELRRKLKTMGITHCTLEFEEHGEICECDKCN